MVLAGWKTEGEKEDLMNDSHKGKKSKAAVESRMSSGGFCHRGGKRGTGKLTSFLCCFVNNQAGEEVGGCKALGL